MKTNRIYNLMIIRPLGCSMDVVIDACLLGMYITNCLYFAAWFMLTRETNVNENKKENEKYQCGTPRGLKKK